MEPNEQQKHYTPEEVAELEKSRTISDAELLKDGAEYVVGYGREKEDLLATEKQKEAMSSQNISQKQRLPISVRSLFTKTQIFSLCLVGVLFFLSIFVLFVLSPHVVIPKETENLSISLAAAGWVIGLILTLLSFVIGVIRAFRRDFKMLVSSIALLFLILVSGLITSYLGFVVSFR